jgi:hypothetical protein
MTTAMIEGTQDEGTYMLAAVVTPIRRLQSVQGMTRCNGDEAGCRRSGRVSVVGHERSSLG